MRSVQWSLHSGIGVRLEETFNHWIEPAILLLAFRLLRIWIILGNWVAHMLRRCWSKGISSDWGTALILLTYLLLTHCDLTTSHLLIRSSITIRRCQRIHVLLRNALKTVLSRDYIACEATHSAPSDDCRKSVLPSIIVIPFLAWDWVSKCGCYHSLVALAPWPLPLFMLCSIVSLCLELLDHL